MELNQQNFWQVFTPPIRIVHGLEAAKLKG